MEIKTEEEIWNDVVGYDCGDEGIEGIPYFNGDKDIKWVKVDDVINTLMDLGKHRFTDKKMNDVLHWMHIIELSNKLQNVVKNRKED